MYIIDLNFFQELKSYFINLNNYYFNILHQLIWYCLIHLILKDFNFLINEAYFTKIEDYYSLEMYLQCLHSYLLTFHLINS